MSTDQDVVVIGGGPAGLAAAAVLGRRHVRVVVLDQQNLPIDKVCGEGMMPPGLRFLEEIGAARLLSPADTAPFSGIRYLTTRGARAETDFEAGPGCGIRRLALSRALTAAATSHPSVTIRDAVRVTGVRQADDTMIVSCDGQPDLSCRLVVGADGLRSRVRRWAGLEGRPAKRHRFGIRQHFQIAPWSRFVDVHCGPGLEAYVTPCGPRTVGVAILWEPKRLGQSPGRDQLFPSLLTTFPDLRDRLADVPALDAPRATGPFEQRTTRRVADGIVLLGDASGYLDPCTGEGLTLAFKQALALESCLLPVFDRQPHGMLRAACLQPFDADWRRITRSYFLCTRFMLHCQRSPALFHRVIRFVGHRPDLLRHFLSFNMGTAPLFPGFRRAGQWLRPLRPQSAGP